MKYYSILFFLLIGLVSNAYGQIDAAVFSPSAPRELTITIKKTPPSDLTKLRIVVFSKTAEGNIEIQSPVPINSSDINLIGGKTHIRVAMTEDLNPANSYMVVVSGYTLSNKVFSFDAFKIDPALTAKLFYNPLACRDGIQLVVNVPKAFRSEVDEVIKWIQKFKTNPSAIAKVEIAKGNENFKPYVIRFLKSPKNVEDLDFNEINTCFDIEDELYGIYTIKLNFTRDLDTPLALQKELKAENFGEADDKPDAITSKNAFVRKGDPGQRTLDNDIEAGFTFTNSKDQDTGKRISSGVLDLQIAPIRNKPFLFIRGNEPVFEGDQNIPKWFGYWTPIFLDANVSTGKITTDTLSLNRVAIGGNFEFRYVPLDFDEQGKAKITRFATYHSFKINYVHYSDRDFKQKEIVGGLEYSPVIGRFNHPRKMNFDFIQRPSNGKFVKTEGNHGYTFAPSFGFEFGRTYSRRNPAPAIKPSDTVKRLFAKFAGKYEYGIFGFSITDQIYYRGEGETDKFKNYFEADLETLLNDFTQNFNHAVFLNYKLGSKPPFNTKADALTIGYRIRFNR